jgi:hypothetical protein
MGVSPNLFNAHRGIDWELVHRRVVQIDLDDEIGWRIRSAHLWASAQAIQEWSAFSSPWMGLLAEHLRQWHMEAQQRVSTVQGIALL